jgi:hypothetical protein
MTQDEVYSLSPGDTLRVAYSSGAAAANVTVSYEDATSCLSVERDNEDFQRERERAYVEQIEFLTDLLAEVFVQSLAGDDDTGLVSG